MAKRRRTRPDEPDLPDALDPGPEALAGGERLEGVRLSADVEAAARLFDLNLVECRFDEVDLSGRRINELRARDVVFTECDLAGAYFGGSCTMTRVQFEGCRLTGVILAGAELTDVVIQRGTVELASFRDAALTRFWCVDAPLREADFSEARLRDCAFLDCDLSGAEFRSAMASGVSLHGSRIEGIRSAGALGKELSIDAEQIIPLGQALVAELGPAVTDRPDDMRA